jgi:hypothetical protein
VTAPDQCCTTVKKALAMAPSTRDPTATLALHCDNCFDAVFQMPSPVLEGGYAEAGVHHTSRQRGRSSRAQQPRKLATVGFLGAGTPSAWSQWTAAFLQRLRGLCWTVFIVRTAAVANRSLGSHIIIAAVQIVRLHRSKSFRDREATNMRKITLASILLGALGLFALPQSPAYATGISFQTWASGAGNDANDCLSVSTPCREIATALSKILPGGVINVLPGSYNAFSVDRAVDIIADQGMAQIVDSATQPSGGTFPAGIYVNAGAGDVVRIRGMTIRQLASPWAAILIASGAALHVENCTLVGTVAGGPAALHFAPTAAANGGVPTELSVRNSAISGNPAGNVLIKPSAGVAVAVLIENTLMAEGPYGIRADNSAGSGLIRVDVRNSVAKGNSSNGFLAVGTGAGPIHFMIDHSTAENNGINGAIATGAQAFMIVGGSTLMGNGTGLAQSSGATVASYGNNGINFNTTNTSGTITPLALK